MGVGPHAKVRKVGPHAGLSNVSGDSDGDNDLQPIVAARHPEIRRIVSSLLEAGSACAAMSGSGSAVFGLFASKMAALDAAGAVKPGNRCAFVTRTITRAQYQRLAGK